MTTPNASTLDSNRVIFAIVVFACFLAGMVLVTPPDDECAIWSRRCQTSDCLRYNQDTHCGGPLTATATDPQRLCAVAVLQACWRQLVTNVAYCAQAPLNATDGLPCRPVDEEAVGDARAHWW